MRTAEEFIEKNNLIKEGDNLVLGLSGGADSVCLFHVLLSVKEKISFNLLAVHVNHSIRETAERDENFVKEMCEAKGVECISFKIDCKKIAGESGLSVEEAGRNERYRLFNEAGVKAFGEGKYKIAVAHHKDDLAETLIFNMARGTKISGLTSVKPESGNVIRPLLCVTRKEIEEYLKENNIANIEDETNESDDYARNKIRHKIIPVMNELCSSAVDHIASMSAQLSEVEDYLNSECLKYYDKYVKEEAEGVFLNDEISSLHKAIQSEIIHKALINTAGRARDISDVHIEAVESLFDMQPGKKRDLIYNMEVLREYKGIRIRVKKESEDSFEERLSRVKWSVSDRDFSQNIPNDLYTKWFDYDKIKNCLKVRFRENKDYLQVNDDGGTKLLSDYMVNEKIPREERDKIPLLADGNHIIWVVGYRISAAYKIDETTKKILIVTYSPEE